MIITCNSCNKKFDIDSYLIPDKGRSLQCASCDHKWFFKKEVLENMVRPIDEGISVDSINIFDQNNSSTNDEESVVDTHKDEVEVALEENSKFNSERVFEFVSQPIKGFIPVSSVSNSINHLSDLPKPDCIEFFVGI